jgi:hypothetical protein
VSENGLEDASDVSSIAHSEGSSLGEELDVPSPIKENPDTNIFQVFFTASTDNSSALQVHQSVYKLNPVPVPRQSSYRVTVEDVPDEDGSVRHLGLGRNPPGPPQFSYQADRDGHFDKPHPRM